MYTMMIVEDEPPIMRNLENKIEKIAGSFSIIYKAFNAEMAYNKLINVQPDVVITDLHMPGKGGLWLLNEIRSSYPDIICVVLSGHKDFEYVRECLRLKIEDYLLKPVTIEMLEHKLKEIQVKIKKLYKQKMYHHLQDMLSRPVPSREIAEPVKRYKFFRALMVYKGSLDFRMKKNIVVQDNVIHDLTEIKKYLSEHLHLDYWVIENDYLNSIFIVFGQLQSDHDQVNYHDLAKSMLKVCDRNACTTIIIGKNNRTPEQLYEESKSMRNRLTQVTQIGRSQILDHSLNDPSEQTIDLLSVEKFNKMFVTHLVRGDSPSFKRELEALFELLIQNHSPQIEVQHLVKRIIRECDFIGRHGDFMATSDLEDEIDMLFFEALDMQEVLKSIWFLIKDIFFNKPASHANKNTEIVNEMEKYLESNYMHNISLNLLSEIFGYTPSYLSRLFKKFKRISPIDYLIQIRIQEAKKMIRENSELFFKDIAARVGYEDQHYFYKLFKTNTGQTLSQYKYSSN